MTFLDAELSAKGLENLAAVYSGDEFSFGVGSEQYNCPLCVAAFLSPLRNVVRLTARSTNLLCIRRIQIIYLNTFFHLVEDSRLPLSARRCPSSFPCSLSLGMTNY
jgi:hypothetical protein